MGNRIAYIQPIADRQHFTVSRRDSPKCELKVDDIKIKNEEGHKTLTKIQRRIGIAKDAKDQNMTVKTKNRMLNC